MLLEKGLNESKALKSSNKIKALKALIFLQMISNQVELSLAYGCSDSLSSEKLLQYVHRNRNHNYLRLAKMGERICNRQ